MEQPSLPGVEDEEEAKGPSVDPSEILGFLLRAGRRHWIGSIATFVVVAGLGGAVASVVQSLYQSESRILVVQTASMAKALDKDMPFADALGGSGETIMCKENLEYIVDQGGLLPRWRESRPKLLRLKDRAMASLVGPPSEADMKDSLVKMLESHLMVGADKNVLEIKAMWPDAAVAQQVATLAQDRFLESRRGQEVSGISTAISILEEEVKRANAEIPPILAELGQARVEARKQLSEELQPAESTRSTGSSASTVQRGSRPAAAAPSAASAASPSATPELTAKLETLRRQRADAEAAWARHKQEQQQRLTDLQVTYGPAHPEVQAQMAKVRAAESEPEPLQSLRQQEAATLAAIASAAQAALVPSAPVPSAPVPTAAPARRPSSALAAAASAAAASGEPPRSIEDEPMVAAARSRLTAALERYNKLTHDLDAARIDLAAASLAFSQRYQVVRQPELPRKPQKPKGVLVGLAGVAAGLLGAFLFGALRELLRGRIIEGWQVKLFGIEHLGEVALARRDKST